MAIDYDTVTNYLDIHTILQEQADLVFVFGTRHPDPAHMAADILLRGGARYVVLTGGVNRLTGINEAHAHRAFLLKRGIPDNRIILEDRSSNTLENALFALPIIPQSLLLEEIKTIIVITKWYHCRRSLMTLKRHFPDGIHYFAETYAPKDTTTTNWQNAPAGRKRVLKEYNNISVYLAKGDIAEIYYQYGGYI